MKKIIILITLFSISLISVAQTESLITSTCALLKPLRDMSTEVEPNIKKLKKMKGKVTSDELVDYAIYLHNYLYPKNLDFAMEQQLDNETVEKQLTIVKDIILPIAQEGNIKAICFLSGKNYLNANDKMELFSKVTTNIPAFIFVRYQMNLKLSGKLGSNFDTYNNNYNRYTLAKDPILKSYFLNFSKDNLLRVREKIAQKIIEISEINKNFNFKYYEFKNSTEELKSEILKKLPSTIDDSSFCMSFGISSNSMGKCYIVPIGYDGNIFDVDAVGFLTILRGAIDLLYLKSNPESLAQILYDYNNGAEVSLENNINFDYLNPQNQYFANDKKWGPFIYKLIAGKVRANDTASYVKIKSYYLNKAAELGATEVNLNLACLYQLLYYNSNKSSYNDTCIYYLEKAILSNNNEAFTLKGIKVFNGEGYPQNKEEGLKLILKAKSLGSTSATNLLETLPQKIFPNVNEGYYFDERVAINYPWDLKVRCSNNCGKLTFPLKIIFGRIYNDGEYGGARTIVRANFFNDDFGNPRINISENDFKETFNITHFGKDWKHVMCSDKCQKNNSNTAQQEDKESTEEHNKFDNELINCKACSKVMKRKDMIAVLDCPCYKEDGSKITVTLTKTNDLFGKSAPRVCSSKCQINYCKTICTSNGYTSQY